MNGIYTTELLGLGTALAELVGEEAVKSQVESYEQIFKKILEM